MKKLDPATYRTVPWKNGGGTTTEAFTLPAGAGLEDFHLRISMARVDADGPFSIFRGVDRTLVVTEGAGLTLETADGARVTLDRASTPFSFTGDDPIRATLADGPVTDFNVMTRASAMRHRAERLTLDAEARTLACAGELTLLVVLDGAVAATRDDAPDVKLARGDILAMAPGDGQALVEQDPDAEPSRANVLLVDFFRR